LFLRYWDATTGGQERIPAGDCSGMGWRIQLLPDARLFSRFMGVRPERRK
jgi:hypothetical protein